MYFIICWNRWLLHHKGKIPLTSCTPNPPQYTSVQWNIFILSVKRRNANNLFKISFFKKPGNSLVLNNLIPMKFVKRLFQSQIHKTPSIFPKTANPQYIFSLPNFNPNTFKSLRINLSVRVHWVWWYRCEITC